MRSVATRSIFASSAGNVRRERAVLLQRVIEVRQIDEAEGGRVFFLHPFRGGGDPLGRGDARRRSPEGGERELAEIAFEFVAHRHRLGVDVEDLASVRRIERPRGDGEIRGGVHVVPPEELGAGEAGDFAAQLVPEFFAADEVVALFPEPDLGGLAVIPAVGDDAVRAGGVPVVSDDCAVQVTRGKRRRIGLAARVFPRTP